MANINKAIPYPLNTSHVHCDCAAMTDKEARQIKPLVLLQSATTKPSASSKTISRCVTQAAGAFQSARQLESKSAASSTHHI